MFRDSVAGADCCSALVAGELSAKSAGKRLGGWPVKPMPTWLPVEQYARARRSDSFSLPAVPPNRTQASQHRPAVMAGMRGRRRAPPAVRGRYRPYRGIRLEPHQPLPLALFGNSKRRGLEAAWQRGHAHPHRQHYPDRLCSRLKPELGQRARSDFGSLLDLRRALEDARAMLASLERRAGMPFCVSNPSKLMSITA